MAKEQQLHGDQNTFFITADDIEVKLETPDVNVIDLSVSNLPLTLVANAEASATVKRQRERLKTSVPIFSKKKCFPNKIAVLSNLKIERKKIIKSSSIHSTESVPKNLVGNEDIFGGCSLNSLHKNKSDEEDRPFQCEQCEKTFKRKGDLKRHQSAHKGIRFECQYEGCTANYARKENLYGHIRLVHKKEDPLLHCDFEGCDYSTRRSEQLSSHRLVHCSEQTFHRSPTKSMFKISEIPVQADEQLLFQCLQCDQLFRTPSELSEHKRTHGSKPRFKCSWEGCEFVANYYSSLKYHQTAHTCDRPFKCDWPECEKTFKLLSHLIQHKRAHDSEPRYRCDVDGCDYSTNYSNSLKNHQIVHTDRARFECDQCDKSYTTSSNLRHHKLSHSREPRYKCSWVGCRYRTHRSGDLKAHQNVHTGQRPFRCSQCDKSFRFSSDLSKHKRTTHEC